MDLFDKNKDKVLVALRAQGIKRVDADFSGGGDDGGIESVRCYKSKSMIVEDEDLSQPIEVIAVESVPNAKKRGAYIEVEKVTTKPLTEAIHELLYAALDKTGYDYVNNEGGSGTITFDVASEKLDINMAVNVMSTEDHAFSF